VNWGRFTLWLCGGDPLPLDYLAPSAWPEAKQHSNWMSPFVCGPTGTYHPCRPRSLQPFLPPATPNLNKRREDGGRHPFWSCRQHAWRDDDTTFARSDPPWIRESQVGESAGEATEVLIRNPRICAARGRRSCIRPRLASPLQVSWQTVASGIGTNGEGPRGTVREP
jgi:hypothetical protein